MFFRTFTFSNILINTLLILLWHMLCFVLCIKCNPSVYNPNKKMFQPKKWERNGKWYESKLHIKKWKDYLPQHAGKEGFSKKHFTNLSLEYIDIFIVETCRAEWNHKMSCIYIIITFIISPLPIAIIFSIFTILANVPFFIIQRYNRFRLLRVKHKLYKSRKD